MSWITYAERPLTVLELRYALGVQQGASAINEENLYDIDDIVSACGGLVTVDRGQDVDTVRLVHYSTQEFLRQSGETYLRDAHQKTALSCLTYLLYDAFDGDGPRDCNDEVDCVKQKSDVEAFVRLHPFLVYATQYWATHADACSKQSVSDTMIQFMRDARRVSNAANVLIFSSEPGAISYDERWSELFRYSIAQTGSSTISSMSGIHLAAFLGFENIVSVLLKNGFAADVRDASNRSPLFWAALEGHSKVVNVLLSLNNIKVNAKLEYDRTYLASRASKNHECGIPSSVLHEHVNLVCTNVLTDGTSAQQATEYEIKAVPRTALTLDTVDVNCQDGHGYTPLLASAGRGHDEVVGQLLKQVYISVNLINRKGESPLLNAVCGGHEGVVKLLLANTGVDINLAPPHTKAWRIRSIKNRAGEVFLGGADTVVGSGSDKCWTPLLAAAFYEHERILKLLLAHHAVDVNCEDINGRMALAIAAKRGNDVMVKFLLEVPGVDLNAVDDNGRTALSQAVYGWLDHWWVKRRASYEDMRIGTF